MREADNITGNRGNQRIAEMTGNIFYEIFIQNTVGIGGNKNVRGNVSQRDLLDITFVAGILFKLDEGN